MAHDVFISYSRKDIEIADEICRAFDNAGIAYWIDRGEIKGGEAYHEKIVEAIRESRITVFISSKNSNMSVNTIKEIVIAFNNQKHIIPLCVDKEPFAPKLEYFLCDLNQLQYYLEREFAIQHLIDDIVRLLGNETTPGKDFAPPASATASPQTALSGDHMLKVRPNLDADIYVDGDLMESVGAGRIAKLNLGRGTFLLEFVGKENAGDRLEMEYKLTEGGDLLNIDLISVRDKRITDIKEKEAKIIEARKKEEEEYKKYLEKLNVQIFTKDGKRGLRNRASAEVIVPPTYDHIDFFQGDTVTTVYINGKAGLINKAGKVIVPMIYDAVRIFPSDELIRVKANGKWGVIDREGKEVIPLKYEDIGSPFLSFTEGYAAVKMDGKWGFIDRNDKLIIPFAYDKTDSFSEGIVAVKKNDCWGYITKDNTPLTYFRYNNEAEKFSGGLARISNIGNDRVKKYGVIDKNGREIAPLIYDFAWQFSKENGLYGVTLHKKQGVINGKGEFVVPAEYDELKLYSSQIEAIGDGKSIRFDFQGKKIG